MNTNTNNDLPAIQASSLGNNAAEVVLQHQVPSETTLSAEGMSGQPTFSDLLLFAPEGICISYCVLYIIEITEGCGMRTTTLENVHLRP